MKWGAGIRYETRHTIWPIQPVSRLHNSCTLKHEDYEWRKGREFDRGGDWAAYQAVILSVAECAGEDNHWKHTCGGSTSFASVVKKLAMKVFRGASQRRCTLTSCSHLRPARRGDALRVFDHLDLALLHSCPHRHVPYKPSWASMFHNSSRSQADSLEPLDSYMASWLAALLAMWAVQELYKTRSKTHNNSDCSTVMRNSGLCRHVHASGAHAQRMEVVTTMLCQASRALEHSVFGQREEKERRFQREREERQRRKRVYTSIFTRTYPHVFTSQHQH